jgi:exodeoxyribonuclease-1
MTSSLFWYDLETTGIDCRDGRIMQFAGVRTDMNLKVLGEPVNVLLRLSEDILPDPDAVLITGITPQDTYQDGLTEAEFLKLFHSEVATPGTIFVGYNTVRFDDEFMRCLNYRNFYDAYEWQWKDGRSRWDLLDVVRMTRALRPEGIEWPLTEDGKPTNRLELITKLNGLDHEQAHDALNDVYATISVAALIRDKQPKLFEWLLSVRDKKSVAKVVESGDPFVYTSGKFSNEFEKTTVVQRIAPHPKKDKALVYDLRYDPTEYLGLSPSGLADRWRWATGSDQSEIPARLPVKTLQYNRCPAVAPLGVLKDAPATVRFPLETISKNRNLLAANPDFMKNILGALEILDKEQEIRIQSKPQDVDARLYDGFFVDRDRITMGVIRTAKPDELSDLITELQDDRLIELLPLYKARNFPKFLSDEERAEWDTYRSHRLIAGGNDSRIAKYMRRLGELAETTAGQDKQYLLEELQLYAESIMPVIDTD